MDAKLIAERHVIERYLAGQLSEDEADAFENSLEEQPELARDVERIARMKTGFAVLQRRGELAALLEHKAPRTKRLAWLAAAAVVLAIGFVALRREAPEPAALIAESLAALSLPSETPVPLRASISLARARGVGADAELFSSGTEQGAAELELAAGPPGTRYAVELLAIDVNGARPVANLSTTANSRGVVRLFTSLHGLAPGPYLLRLTPADAAPPLEYSLAVRPPR
ncbi:MAG TPA: hypothetical protein VMF52_04805 [Steroidobacteraceae bacterium]|nr:hypothetical protein [Steroidobacteraceae bacterium]